MKISLYARDGYQIELTRWNYADGIFTCDMDVTSPKGEIIRLQSVTINVEKQKLWFEWLKRIDGTGEAINFKDIGAAIFSRLPVAAMTQVFQAVGGLFDIAKVGRK